MKKTIKEMTEKETGRRSKRPVKSFISCVVPILAKGKRKAHKDNIKKEYKRLKRHIQSKKRQRQKLA